MAFNVSYNFIANDQFSAAANKIKQSAQKIRDSVKSTSKTFNTANIRQKNVGKSLTVVSGKFKQSGKALAVIPKRVTTINSSFKKTGKALAVVPRSLAILDASFKRSSKTGATAGSRLSSIFKKMKRVVGQAFIKMASLSVRSFIKMGVGASRLINKLKRLKRTSKGVGRGIGAGFKSLVVGAGIFLGIKKAINVGAEFQDSLADLEAITGATGKSLSKLTSETLRLAKASAISQAEVATSIKLVASQKSELLKNIPALISVTEQVLLLKNAAGIDLAAASEITTQSLNIFGAEANQTARFVNVLAAGAKFGASEIGDTGAAVILAGAKARAAGLNFEDLNAIIQVVAKGGFKGAQAGTALSAIIGRLTRAGIDFNKMGLQGGFEAVKNAIEAQIDPTQRALLTAKIFGEEHDKVGLSILNNVKLISKFRSQITGTNVAQEQASIRLSTFNTKMRRLGVIIKDKIIRLFQKLEPTLSKLAVRFGEFIDSITPVQIEDFANAIVTAIPKIVNAAIKMGEVFRQVFSGASIISFNEALSGTLGVLGLILDAAKVVGSIFKGVGITIGESFASAPIQRIFTPQQQDVSTSLRERFSIGGKLFGVFDNVPKIKPSIDVQNVTPNIDIPKIIPNIDNPKITAIVDVPITTVKIDVPKVTPIADVSRITPKIDSPRITANINVPTVTAIVDIPKVTAIVDVPTVTPIVDVPNVIAKIGIPKVTAKIDIPNITPIVNVPRITPNINVPTITPIVDIPKVTAIVDVPKITPIVNVPNVTAKIDVPKITPIVNVPRITADINVPRITPNINVPTITPIVDVPNVIAKIGIPKVTAKIDIPNITPNVNVPTITPNIDIPKITVLVDTPKITPKIDVPKVTAKVDVPKITPIVDIPRITEKVEVTKISNIIDFPKIKAIPIINTVTPALPEVIPTPVVTSIEESKATVDINIRAPAGVVEKVQIQGTQGTRNLNVGVNMREAG